jgi:hypothetical protein
MDEMFHRFRDPLIGTLHDVVKFKVVPSHFEDDMRGLEHMIVRAAYDEEGKSVRFRSKDMPDEMFTGLTDDLVRHGESFNTVWDLEIAMKFAPEYKMNDKQLKYIADLLIAKYHAFPHRNMKEDMELVRTHYAQAEADKAELAVMNAETTLRECKIACEQARVDLAEAAKRLKNAGKRTREVEEECETEDKEPSAKRSRWGLGWFFRLFQ